MRTEPVGTEPKDTNFRAAEYSDRTPTSQNGTSGQWLATSTVRAFRGHVTDAKPTYRD